MKKTKVSAALGLMFFLFALTPNIYPQGHIEIGVHYSRWSINILKSLIEEGIGDALETKLKDTYLEDIQQKYNLTEQSYSQEISFDSSGNNYGFEIRFYPGGKNGSFSLGLSIEKTTMKVMIPEISSNLNLSDGSTFEGLATGQFILNPLSYHLSLRWDIIPSSRIRPYITIGVGAATGTALKDAEFSYSYVGDLSLAAGGGEHYEGGEDKTIEELKEEVEDEGEDFFLPGFIPFIQLNLGLKAELVDNIHFLADAGIWDGFLIRGGIAFRF